MNLIPRNIIFLKPYFVLFVCILFSLIFIFSNKAAQIETIKVSTLDLMGFFRSRLSFFSKKSSLKEQNKFLRYHNTILSLENSRMREAILENQRLRKLLGFKQNNEFNLIASKVIGRSDLSFINNILIDVGKQDGVNKNMPVVSPNGLIGKIYRVGNNHSIVHLLLDQNFRISGKVLPSGIMGIVSWKSRKICELREIPNRTTVAVGDSVFTSGFSEIFPEGIYIGKIISSVNTHRSLFMDIKLKPDVNFNKLEEVFVITSVKLEE